ncbi:MAG: hypothetical protein IJY71_03795 [Clostridia bacterium]|nr:hypothetical protein [Clostridia bacterium]
MMNHQDTARLLRECNAGIVMGVSSLEDVLPHVKNARFAEILASGKKEHALLAKDARAMLRHYNMADKEPSAVVRAMAKMKTEMRLMMKEKDTVVADMITQGCHMGVKSLSRYLNQYKEAEQCARDLAGKLVALEDRMAKDIRPYL